MNTQTGADPASLENLHEIVLGDPIPWWPPAPGWFVLAGVLSLVLVVLGWYLARRWFRNRYRRAALMELERLSALVKSREERKAALARLPEILKRTALAGYPRQEVASLSGQAWLEFLRATTRTGVGEEGGGRLLVDLSFKPGAAREASFDDAQRVLEFARKWLRRHETRKAE